MNLAWVFLDAALTSMICYQLLCHARALKKRVGEEYAAPYFSVMRLLVESVLPLTLTGIAFLISYGVRSASKSCISLVYALMMVRCWNSAFSTYERSLMLIGRFLGCITADVDLTSGGGNCMAERRDKTDAIVDDVLFTWRYIWLR